MSFDGLTLKRSIENYTRTVGPDLDNMGIVAWVSGITHIFLTTPVERPNKKQHWTVSIFSANSIHSDTSRKNEIMILLEAARSLA